MTEKFVTLPCEMVKQALNAFETDDWQKKLQAAIVLRAALEQPQVEQKAFAWISPRALEWGTRQSEKVVKLTCKAQPEYDFTEPLYTHPQPQPQGEQEPVGKLIADPYEGHIFIPYGDSWPFNEDLYTRPQPKREPLTDEEIDKLCPQFDDPMRREMWIIGFKAAYNIK